jgi:hypothetical protein
VGKLPRDVGEESPALGLYKKRPRLPRNLSHLSHTHAEALLNFCRVSHVLRPIFHQIFSHRLKEFNHSGVEEIKESLPSILASAKEIG